MKTGLSLRWKYETWHLHWQENKSCCLGSKMTDLKSHHMTFYFITSKFNDTLKSTKSPCCSLASLEWSFVKELLLVTSTDLASKTIMFYIFLLGVASRQNLSSHFLCRISHRLILQTQIISCHLMFLYLRPPRRVSLIIANFINWTAVSLPNPVLYVQTNRDL